MAGNITEHSAAVWFQTKEPSRVFLRYQTGFGLRLESPAVETSASNDFAASIHLADLPSNAQVRYSVVVRTEKGEFESADYELHTAPGPGVPVDFRVVLGSCAYKNDPLFEPHGPGGDYQIFNSMAKANPQIVLWLGDNTYLRLPDLVTPDAMASRFRKDRALPDLAQLLHTGAHYAIWDDHDYGPNDAKRDFAFKNTSLQLFRRYWINPVREQSAGEGIYTRFQFGDVEFFLLDDRWHREDDRSPAPGRSMLGTAQLQWLKDSLTASHARFKIVANGSQLFNDSNRFEGWQNFPEERSLFLDWLAAKKVPGVFFVTGDRHRTEMISRSHHGYPVLELTCSPLTSASRTPPENEKENPARVPGTLVSQRNFCILDFFGTSERKLVMSSLDSDGKMIWKKEAEAIASGF